MLFRRNKKSLLLVCAMALLLPQFVTPAQGQTPTSDKDKSVSLGRYIDQTSGLTADDAVAYALSHNLELQAARKEIDAAKAMVKQARLRPNPKLDIGVSQNITGTDHTIDAGGSLPLELGGRRSARITVAEREVEVREREFGNNERTLAAEVRMKFGETLAQSLKLSLTDERIESNQQSFNLVAARVTEGATAPLEQNMVLVELNRLRSQRESAEGKLEVLMLDLKNLIGMQPQEPLRLRGDFNHLVDQLPSVIEATDRALHDRPDLMAARAVETWSDARIEQARAEGRLDASLSAGYEHMTFGFPVRGVDDAGRLQPVSGGFHYLKFGISLDLPVRNKNQGAIEAAVAEAEAAKRRREFAELAVKHEVASAYAQYERSVRAMEIFRVGVNEQAKANLDVVRQTYELGSKTLIDYLVEQRHFIDLENDFIDAQLAAYDARVQIARATASPELIKR
jgi:cobalt-zinc-cadmium efflux system outer membrane protein